MADALDTMSVDSEGTSAEASPVIQSTGRKRAASGAIVARKEGRAYLSMVTNEADEPIYINKTSSMLVRESAVKGGAPHLRKYIESKRGTSWLFKEHFKLLPECPDGVPESRAEELKCYFIAKYKTSLLFNDGVSNGMCNLTFGKNVSMHESKFAAIDAELAASGGCIKMPTTEKPEVVFAEAQEMILFDLTNETADSESGELSEVSSEYALAHKNALTIKGTSDAKIQVDAYLEKYKRILTSGGKRALNKAPTVAYDEFASDLNGLMDTVQKMEPENQQEECQKIMLEASMKALRGYIKNGEVSQTAAMSPLKAATALGAFKSIQVQIQALNATASRSFQSTMAWTRPSFIEKGTKAMQGKEKALERLDKDLTEKEFTPLQRAELERRRANINNGFL